MFGIFSGGKQNKSVNDDTNYKEITHRTFKDHSSCTSNNSVMNCPRIWKEEIL
jgi:hypothetical protein